MEINDCVGLVTGGNRGIGEAFVRVLLQSGARKVYAGSRDPAAAAHLVEQFPGRCIALELDVTDYGEVARAARECNDVSLVVNNAGLFVNQTLLGAPDMSIARAEMEVNYFGTLAMCRAFAPVLAANGGGGIINVLSAAALAPIPNMGGYGPSKAAARSLSGCVRAELANQGTQVTALIVGSVDTRMAAHVEGGKEQPDDIARAGLRAVSRGIDEMDTDRMAVEVRAALALDPKALEKRMARMLHVPVIRTGRWRIAIVPTDILQLILVCAATIFGFWITLWLISLVIRDSSIGDPLYPVGMAITAGVFYVVCDGNPARQQLVLALTLTWAARLAWHIGVRNWGREDARYARLRAHAASLGQNYAWYSLTHVFLSLGAASGVAIAFPLFLAQRTPEPPLGALAYAGVALFVIGLTLETVADIQLKRFLRNPANHNQVMRSGLWRYSRHPNYFGEFLVWCGFFLIALETPWGWLAIVSPLTLAYILLGPLGIGLVERRMRKKRPEAFADYERATSPFIPWPPRS